jgi:glycosyltransferase involved in cell wall biosynthesis
MVQPIIQLIGSGAIGGGTTVVLGLSQGLAERGIPVVVASDRGSYLIAAARASGLATLELDFDRRMATPRLAFCIARAIQALKPALLHAHGARAGLPAALVPKSIRVPFVYTVHGFHYGRKPAGVRALARQAERFCMNRAAATVFVSDFDRGLASGDDVIPDRSPHVVIHNGAMAAKKDPNIEPQIDIIFLGRLHPQKNPLALADILLALRPLEPVLAIIGNGEYEAALRERLRAAGVAHQVRFLGARASAEALELLGRARVLVLPSRSEGLPVAVIEAMHHGVPAVASNVGGVSELIEDGVTGFLVEPDDIAGFADRLGCLLADEPRRVAMGEAARTRAQAAFSVERNVEQHLALYDHVRRPSADDAIGLLRWERCDA